MERPESAVTKLPAPEAEVPLQVLIPEHIRRQLAVKAAEEGRSLRSLAATALRGAGDRRKRGGHQGEARSAEFMNYWISRFHEAMSARPDSAHRDGPLDPGVAATRTPNNPVGRSAPLRRRMRQAQPRRVIREKRGFCGVKPRDSGLSRGRSAYYY